MRWDEFVGCVSCDGSEERRREGACLYLGSPSSCRDVEQDRFEYDGMGDVGFDSFGA